MNSSDRLYSHTRGNPVRFIDSIGLFTWEPTCQGCFSDDWPERRNRFDRETKMFCNSLDSFITDVALSNCMKGRCESTVISCTGDCGTYHWPDGSSGAPGAYANPRGRSVTQPSDNVVICTNTWNDRYFGHMGYEMIHEFAHLCGWRHGGGNGVPDPNTTGYFPGVRQ